MKKLLLAILVAFLLVFTFKTEAKADDIDRLNGAFLTDGEFAAPENFYVRIEPFDGDSQQRGRYYTTQSEDVMAMLEEWDLLGEEAFNEKYGFIIDNIIVQHDIKLDDGDWHYFEGWDENNYDNGDMPDYMCVYCLTPAFLNTRILTQGYNLDLWYMDEDGSNWGFMKDLVKVKDGYRYMDLDKHTLYFRSRYHFSFLQYDAEGNYDYYHVYSDWTPEVSIGKKGSLEPLKEPAKLDAPVLSDMVLKNAYADEYGSWCDWNVFWTYPAGVFEADLYFLAELDAFEPISIDTQCRVDGGEWMDITVANAASLYGGYRTVRADDCIEDSTVEVRSRFCCRYDESKTSDWSNIVSNKAVAGTPVTSTTSKPEQKPSSLLPDISVSEGHCKLCGVCPFQPKGICLFIWILLILIVAFLVCMLVKKIMKKQQKKTGKVTLIQVLLVLLFVVVLVLWIRFIILNKKGEIAGNNGSIVENILGNSGVEGISSEASEEPASTLTLLSNGEQEKEEESSTPIGGSESSSESGGLNFPGYTESGNWPTASEWAQMGLPDLPLSCDVDGTVSISGKSWIYPLNAKDGYLFEAKTEDEQFEGIKAKLDAAGITGEYYSESDPVNYYAYYDNNGTYMKIYITQTSRIDMGGDGNDILPKISVLIQFEPED